MRIFLVTLSLVFIYISSPSFGAIEIKAPNSQEYVPYLDTFHKALELLPTSTRPLIVTLGHSELLKQLDSLDQTPVLALLVTSANYKQTIDQFKDKVPTTHISAIYSDPNPMLQIALSKQLSSNRRILIAATHGNLPNLTSIVQPLRADVSTIIIPDDDLKPLFIAMEKYDALIAVPDSNLYNVTSIQSIITSLYRRDKYLIGYSQGMVRAGALATVSTDKEQISIQMRAIIERYFSSGELAHAAYSSEFSVFINKTLARSLGVYNVDENELKKRIINAVREQQ
jgi:hypothetical protein